MTGKQKPKRDNAYYEERLKRSHPTVHADYLAGKFPSLTQALNAAGITKPRTRLHELKNAWQKAAPAERREFLQWLKPQSSVPTSVSQPVVSTSPITTDGRLERWAIDRVKYLMSKRNIRMGDLLQQLGFNKYDPSLGIALRDGTRIRPDLIAALEAWIKAHDKL